MQRPARNVTFARPKERPQWPGVSVFLLTAGKAVKKVTEKAGRVSTEMMHGTSKRGKTNGAATKGTPKTVPTGAPVFTQQDLAKLKLAVAELEVHRGSLEYAQQSTAQGIQVGRTLRTAGGGIAEMMRNFDGSTTEADTLREKLGDEGDSASTVEANLSKLMADWTRDAKNSKESLRTVRVRFANSRRRY